MDTVTESSLAIKMAQMGGLGIIHKNFDLSEEEKRELKMEQGRIKNSAIIAYVMENNPEEMAGVLQTKKMTEIQKQFVRTAQKNIKEYVLQMDTKEVKKNESPMDVAEKNREKVKLVAESVREDCETMDDEIEYITVSNLKNSIEYVIGVRGMKDPVNRDTIKDDLFTTVNDRFKEDDPRRQKLVQTDEKASTFVFVNLTLGDIRNTLIKMGLQVLYDEDDKEFEVEKDDLTVRLYGIK